MRLIALFLVLLVWIPWPETSGAKILAILSITSRSHHIWNRSLMLALASRGHQVTVFSPDREKAPVKNLREIIIEGAYEHIMGSFDYETMDKLSTFENVPLVFDWGNVASSQAIESKAGRALIELTKNETFDLIIVESLLHDCFLGLVPKFGNPPVVGITAFGSTIWTNFAMGNPEFPSYITHYSVPYSSHMTLFQRIHNLMVSAYTIIYRDWIHIPNQDAIVRKYLGEGIPSIKDLERNISLILVNNNAALDTARPYVPTVIPVGGMHITPSKPLPEDLKKFMDGAEHGVIFFSLGSNVRSDKLQPEKRQAILDTFAQLPQRVLWKFESDGMVGKPSNVMISKWLPQNDILGHPNLKLFITHCGLLSTQETVYHGVPVVGIPFLVDQHVNIHKAITHGFGVRQTMASLTKDTFLKSIRTVLNNPSYKARAEVLSRQFRDQTETPLERAVFWVEYVIRHGGTKHLHCVGADMSIFSYFLLDIFVLFILGAAILLLTLRFVLKIIYRAICGGAKDKRSAKTKKN